MSRRLDQTNDVGVIHRRHGNYLPFHLPSPSNWIVIAVRSVYWLWQLQELEQEVLEELELFWLLSLDWLELDTLLDVLVLIELLLELL